MKKVYCLGIDTSNYTTSAALVDENLEVIAQSRQLLYVKRGERGLRQSQALFEHMKNIPSIVERVMEKASEGRIGAVCASTRPRPVEGSYMPVFRSGESYGRVIASVLGVRFFETSHQEGHLAAVKVGGPFADAAEFLGLHLSGGTTEILRCRDLGDGFQVEIVGGTKDLSAGQLIDRVGVAMGLGFPCGRELDEMASPGAADRKLLKKIHVDGSFMNLSGIETQAIRLLEGGEENSEKIHRDIAVSLFYRLAEAFSSMIRYESKETGIQKVLMAGGVSSSKFLRAYLVDSLGTDVDLAFGNPALSSDNAVGVARLGMKQYLKSRG